MAGQHALTVVDTAPPADVAARPSPQPCPFDTSCDGCGVALRKGWPVRETTGSGPVVTGFMCCPCWWGRTL